MKDNMQKAYTLMKQAMTMAGKECGDTECKNCHFNFDPHGNRCGAVRILEAFEDFTVENING